MNKLFAIPFACLLTAGIASANDQMQEKAKPMDGKTMPAASDMKMDEMKPDSMSGDMKEMKPQKQHAGRKANDKHMKTKDMAPQPAPKDGMAAGMDKH